ncbi:MAG: hypothetical protein KBC38_02565 [Candidatus Pacebacteria bacterium]|nr:hypothetical protein [Candidatus Paceibacterota bacterium]MBP9840360.1 hypothetical protein [Candidatus Paceibacterota bacterium]
MVGRILRRLEAPVRGLHEAAYLIAGLTLASQALALLRDRLFAGSFGASETLDLYYAAFRIPDLVFALVASLVSAYVLIPRIATVGNEEARRLVSHAASFLLIIGGALSAILAFFAPSLVFILFPDLRDAADADGFVLLSQILLLQPILLGLSAILMSITQVKRRFFVFALSPVLYNLGIIGGIFLYPSYGLMGIGIGVVIGAAAHLALQLPTIARERLLPRLVLPDLALMREIIRDSVPRSLALGVGSLTVFVLTALAARTGDGGISVFTLAMNLAAVPLALIGASYATAAFPSLAEKAGQGDGSAFRATLSTALRHLIFWSASVTVLVIVLRAHLVRTILGAGVFDWEATRLTAAILAVLAVGLIAQGVILLASRAFYAARRSWNPLLIQLAGLLVSALGALGALALAGSIPSFRFFFEALLRVSDVPGTDVLFIALGATVGQLFMGALALLTLAKVAPGVASGILRPLSEGLGAAIIGGSAAYLTLFLLGNIASLSTLMAVFTQGLAAGIVGLAASALVLVLLENREFKDLYRSLRALSTRALPPQSEF